MSSLIERYGLTLEMPRHVAIIMDGNGRWAKTRGLPRAAGHRAGVEALRGVIEASDGFGIEALSLYAFSTENWRRPKTEVSALFELVIEYFKREIEELNRKGVRISIFGDIEPLPSKTRRTLEQAMDITERNQGLKLNIAINYGARAEIARAARMIAEDVESGRISAAYIDEACIEKALYTSGMPELDLIIRTGGEKRLSNFLLYQAAYSELVFIDTLFPDFSEQRYAECMIEYQNRSRRYGGL